MQATRRGKQLEKRSTQSSRRGSVMAYLTHLTDEVPTVPSREQDCACACPPFAEMNICLFPLVGFKGNLSLLENMFIFSRGLKQMEVVSKWVPFWFPFKWVPSANGFPYKWVQVDGTNPTHDGCFPFAYPHKLNCAIIFRCSGSHLRMKKCNRNPHVSALSGYVWTSSFDYLWGKANFGLGGKSCGLVCTGSIQLRGLPLVSFS